MNWIRTILDGKYSRLLCIAGLVVIFDQITKAIVLTYIPLYQSIPVIPGVFSLTHLHNPGGAFGFLAKQSSGIRHLVFIVLSSAAISLIFYFYWRTPRSHPLLAGGFALILGGAIGNLIDRVRFEKVVDFLDFYIGRYHWPAFNVADSAITVGIGIFLVHILWNKIPD
jgi:signal peptidase II